MLYAPDELRPCPCGSEAPLARCCGPRLAGVAPASTAEALMRSRYSAYAMGDTNYLLRSWHPSSRPADIDSAAGPQWTGLEIVKLEAGGPDHSSGSVEFRARYLDGAHLGTLHETSRFVREDGRWLYLDGELHNARREDVGRNVACPCGSGRKFKRCCGA